MGHKSWNDTERLKTLEYEGVEGGIMGNEGRMVKDFPLGKVLGMTCPGEDFRSRKTAVRGRTRQARSLRYDSINRHEVAVEFGMVNVGVGIHLFEGIVAVVKGFKIDG